VTRKVTWQLIILVWSLGLVASALGGLQLIVNHSPWRSCQNAIPETDGDRHDYFLRRHRGWLATLNLCLCYVLPMSLLTYIYLRIFWAARKNSITVRKQSSGVGVERTFPLHSPKIEKIDVKAIGDVRRAKLYYLRDRVGRSARVRELRQ